MDWGTVLAALATGIPAGGLGALTTRRARKTTLNVADKQANIAAIDQARVTYQAIVQAQTEEIARIQAEANAARAEAAEAKGTARDATRRADMLDAQIASQKRIIVRMAQILREHHIDLPDGTEETV